MYRCLNFYNYFTVAYEIDGSRGVVVITTAQLHSTKPELRFAMVRISDNGPGWK